MNAPRGPIGAGGAPLDAPADPSLTGAARPLEGGAIFTLAELGVALRRRWLLVLALTLAGGAGGFLAAKTITPHYKAEAALISDSALAAISDGTREGATVADPSVTPTIVESISASAVLERALDALTPGERARLLDESGVAADLAAAPGNAPAGAADREKALLARFLSQTLEVTNSGRSYVIYVSHVSTDPELSAAIANAVAEAYLGYRAELKRSGYRTYLDGLATEIDTLKSRLDDADRAAQTLREQAALLATRTGAMTGQEQEAAIAQSADLYARQREAEREAEAAGSVYERLLLNRRDVESRFNTPDLGVQLYALATPPLRPNGLNVKPLLLALGLAAGFCLGASLALIGDRRGASKRRRTA